MVLSRKTRPDRSGAAPAVHNRWQFPRQCADAMNIIILDDYQDAVRKLSCAAMLEPYNAKVFTNTVKGIGQLSVRLKDADVLVLIRERTQFPRCCWKAAQAEADRADRRVGAHIDIEACTRLGIAVAEGVGSPVAPAELTWALIMAAMRRLPQYVGNLKHGAWQQSGLKSASMPPNFGIGMVLRGRTLGIWGATARSARWWPATAALRHDGAGVWGSEASRERAEADGHLAAAVREQFLRELRRAQPAPAPADGDARHRHAGRPDAHEADRAAGQHLARRADRGRRTGLGAQPRRPGMAAVDVFESEPILQGHPLLRLENAVCTPHIGYVELDSYEIYFRAAFENVINFINQEPDEHRQPRGAESHPMKGAAWALLALGNFVPSAAA